MNLAHSVDNWAAAAGPWTLLTLLMSVLLLQVLKGSLSVHQPTIMCDDFVYEEGDDLDEDELAANAANLPKALQALPGTVMSMLFDTRYSIAYIAPYCLRAPTLTSCQWLRWLQSRCCQLAAASGFCQLLSHGFAFTWMRYSVSDSMHQHRELDLWLQLPLVA